MNCIFCEIIKGNIPCYKVYEDEYSLAFLDIAQEGVGHTLVVPKKHFPNLVEIDSDYLEKCMSAVQKITSHYIKDCGFTGANIEINNGETAGQSIHHLHIHIIPRKENDGIQMWRIKKSENNLEDIRRVLEVK